ncbi:MAG: macro domain-containing protein [Candidatus Thorarchaeota archaeon]
MPIIYKINENIFKSEADALVNTVNCKGIMGKGLAKEFKERYPEMFKDYRKKCESNQLKIGKLHLFQTLDHLIINFPTKIHWKHYSRLEWIESGLLYFVNNYKKWNIKSVAFPQLGTSYGKLEWEVVKPLMENYLGPLDIEVEIYTKS